MSVGYVLFGGSLHAYYWQFNRNCSCLLVASVSNFQSIVAQMRDYQFSVSGTAKVLFFLACFSTFFHISL